MTKAKTKDTESELFNAPPTAEQAATGKAVAVRKPRAAPEKIESRVVPVTGLAEIIGAVERMSANPATNADVADRMLTMLERLMDRQARLAFNRAFVEMTAELPPIPKKGRIIVLEKTASGRRDGAEQQNTPYAKWETTAELIKPKLRQYGFGIQHRISTTIDGTERRVRVTAVLRHDEGHVDDSCYFDLAADSTGSKNNAQAWASSVSYAKRHTAFAVLGLIAEGEDDDAKSSGKPVIIGDQMTEEEVIQVREFAEAVECPLPALLDHLNKKRPKNHPAAKTLGDLPQSRLQEALDALKSWEANAPARKAAEAQKVKP